MSGVLVFFSHIRIDFAHQATIRPSPKGDKICHKSLYFCPDYYNSQAIEPIML